MGAFCAASFWWSEKQAVVYAQKTKQAVTTGPGHKAGSDAGRKLFESTCAGCHGLDGRGGEKGPNIATRPEISRRSDDEILAILQHGVPGTGMPAFSRLGDAKLQAVVRHLRSLQEVNSKTAVAGNAVTGENCFLKKAGMPHDQWRRRIPRFRSQ
jgi:mono/diheme cytochrome c family protein